MATLKLTVTVTEDSNQYEEEMEFDLDKLRVTPNPRQCLVAGFLMNARHVIAEYDPSFNI